ncbi:MULTISPECIES: GFA family protein [unclassified Pseudomonas]|uniref:GFA family protein n=1 Tax=unclassified Pseudomonas TaxID=196821 RepID=UPI0015A2E91F|nr:MULTISPECIES: GFA family protein [unclassified Pseudomonas]NWC96582.1 GFA family protein [Pseudomonas sp. IPO3779]NWD21160.1 GFA family protein [Pseudomonas sp. IPO3778]
MTLTGQCRCANVTYTLNTDAPLAVYACHCRHCQTWSGSAFALHALLPAEALKVAGVLTEYAYDVDGQRSEHQLCGVCHTRVYNTTTAAPGLVVLRVGTLDQSPAVQPVAHIWVRHKQPWVALTEGAPTWLESPTPQAFWEALSKPLS